MTVTQFIASILYVASYELSTAEAWRYHQARRALLKALRGIG